MEGKPHYNHIRSNTLQLYIRRIDNWNTVDIRTCNIFTNLPHKSILPSNEDEFIPNVFP